VDLWWTHAREYHVLPLDDRDWERAALRLAMNTRTRYQYYAGMARTDRLSAPDITDRSYRIVARFDANEATMTEGVILAWGSRFGGIGLYLKGGRVRYRYVYSQDVSYMLEGDLPTGSGGHEIRVDFERMGNHSGRAVLAIDGTEAGRVDIPKTWPTHGVTAGLNCGQDAGAPVCDDYAAPFEFNGGNLDVVIELANDGARDPKGRYQAALNEQ